MSCNSAVPAHVIGWNKNANKVTIRYKYSRSQYVSIRLTVIMAFWIVNFAY